MASIFDDIGGAVQGAENAVGGFLQNLNPFGGSSQASAPAPAQNPPLPTPNNQVTSPLGGMSPRQNYSSGWDELNSNQNQFAQDTGLADLGQRFQNVQNQLGAGIDLATQDLTTDINGNPIAKSLLGVQNADQANRVAKLATNPVGYFSDVINAGVMDPIGIMGRPQQLLSGGNETSKGVPDVQSVIWNNLGGGTGHNYLRDMVSGIMEHTSGEKLPLTMYDFQERAQNLNQEAQQLEAAQSGLTPQSPQIQIDAYNAKLKAYQQKFASYDKDYKQSQDWWQNSATAKVLSASLAAAAIPATVGIGWRAPWLFYPQIAHDPAGFASQTWQSLRAATGFAEKLVDPEAVKRMSGDEWSANIQNIGNIGMLLFGAKHPVDALRGKIADTVLGRRFGPLTKDRLLSEMYDKNPELKNPDAAPFVHDPNPDQPHVAEQRAQDVKALQARYRSETDPAHKEALLKQINDLTDRKSVNDQLVPAPANASGEEVPPFDEYEQLSQQRQNVAGYESISDVAREKELELNPNYTKPVYPQDPYNDHPADTILKDMQDFTLPANQARAMREHPEAYASPSMRSDAPPPKINQSILKKVAAERNWKIGASKSIEYGWLFPGGKGIELGYSRNLSAKDAKSIALAQARADHRELWMSLENVTGTQISPAQWRDLQAENSWVQLRRGVNQDADDYYFWVPEWSDSVKGVIEDYLFSRYEQGKLPKYVTIEKAPSLGAGTGRRVLGEFSWDEFKRAGMNINELVNRIYRPPDLLNTSENANEKGATQTGLGPTPDTPGQEYNQAQAPQTPIKPSEAPEGSTATAIITNPETGTAVSFWEPSAESTRSISPLQRGIVEAREAYQKLLDTFQNLGGEDEDIPKLEAKPINWNRRVSEIKQVLQQRVQQLDPLGIININNIIFDPHLASDAQFDPGSGNISINPYKMIPVSWARNLLGITERGLLTENTIASPQGMALAHDWIKEIANMSQADLDFAAIAEEILHKYDVDHLTLGGYFDGLARLPTAWWDHAARSGLDDAVEGGLKAWVPGLKAGLTERAGPKIGNTQVGSRTAVTNTARQNRWVTVQDINGNPVESWMHAFDLGKRGLLSPESLAATTHTFMEYRVSQLRNYHGVPGTLFTYRVPEVIARELENPELISEGARLAGDDFERYVQAETAFQLSAKSLFDEEEAAKAARSVSAIPDEHTATGTDTTPALPTTSTPGGGRPGIGNQESIKPSSDVPKDNKGNDYPKVGDTLEVNLERDPKLPAKWSKLTNEPLRDGEDINKAIEMVLNKGVMGLNHLPGEYRVRSPRGRARIFKDRPPVEPQKVELTGDTGSEVAGEKAPDSFHGITPPDIIPQEEPTASDEVRSRRLAGQGFNKRAMDLAFEGDLSKKPIPVEPPKSIGRVALHQPILELGRTGYPGEWEDFLKAMMEPQDSIAYKMAKPYWDKMDAKTQKAWMEAMQEPGVQASALERADSEKEPEISPQDVSSPVFQARQAKIQQYQASIAQSGSILDKLSRAVNTKAGRDKYFQAKSKVAAMQKYVEVSRRGVAEKDALNQMGQEYTKTMEELTNQGNQGEPRLPEIPTHYGATQSAESQLQPNLRAYLTQQVTVRSESGGIAKGYYSNLQRFFDAYAGGEADAKKIYAKLPKLAKDAIKDIVTTNYPQSFKTGLRDRPDQSSIPQSQQGGAETINPVRQADLRAIAQTAPKAFVRHGSTEYNEKGLIRAHENVPLSSLGRLQARNLGAAFAGRTNLKVVTHDLERAYDTAVMIARRARGSKVTADPNLRPWDVGKDLQGSSIVTGNPKMMDWMNNKPDFVPEGGESFNQYKVRFLTAIQQYLYSHDVFVVSTRNMRLLESWMRAGMKPDFSLDTEPLQSPREIGPGGIMEITHQPDGTFTVGRKASQNPSTAGTLEVAPKVPQSQVSLRPEKLVFNRPQRTEPVRMSKPTPATTPEGVKANFKLTLDAEEKAANLQGELPSSINPDIADRVDAIVKDPSIPATSPIKIAAAKAQVARHGIETAKSVRVPDQALREQVNEYTVQLGKITELLAKEAQQKAKLSEVTAPKPENQLTWDVSLKKAQEHQNRMMQGEDHAVSAARAAKEMGIFDKNNPLGDAKSRMSDASIGVLPKGHPAYSLSPAFKEVFIDPKAVQIVRESNLADTPKQGLLPVTHEEAVGADLPPVGAKNGAAIPKGKFKITIPVVPAVAEHMADHTPSGDVPTEEHPTQIAKGFRLNIEDAKKGKSTRDARNETAQVTELINTPSPNPFQDQVREDMEELNRDRVDAARGRSPFPDEGAASGSGAPPPSKPPSDPFHGWDGHRDFAKSFDGLKNTANLLDYALKNQATIHNPSAKAAHPIEMAKMYIRARLASIYLGDEVEKALMKVLGAKKDADDKYLPLSDAELARHQAIMKGISGPEIERLKNVEALTNDADAALANMMHSYWEVMGKLGMRAEAHLFDEAQEGYARRRVLFSDGTPVDKIHGNSRFTKKQSIAFERRKAQVPVGFQDGKEVLQSENLYKDNQALKDAGFRVDENIASLWKNHWDQFSNMNATHQMIQHLSTLHTFGEFAKMAGKFGIPKDAVPFYGSPLIPKVPGKATQVDPKYASQVTTITKGPWQTALNNYLVYKPVADVLERMATTKDGASTPERIANLLSTYNGYYKVFKFGFNPIHLFNLYSNIYALGTKGRLDVNFKDLNSRVFGRTDGLLSEKLGYKDWDGSDIHGKQMIAKIMGWGGVQPKEIINVANLEGPSKSLAKNVPGFKQWHDFLWQGVAWKGHIGLTLHMLDVMRNQFSKEVGRDMNEAEFDNAGRLATSLSKYSMGFLDKTDMTRDWQLYGNSLFFANAWTTSQLRWLGMATPKGIPGRDYLANWGGGENHNEIVTDLMRSEGQMDQRGLDVINGFQGQMARKMMLGGAVKLLAASTIMSSIGSLLSTGQVSTPWQNFQRNPVHTFDIYQGTDSNTGKDKWLHNPTFGMQQEMALYMLQAMKEWKDGGNPLSIAAAGPIRFLNKLNPFLSTPISLAIQKDLTLYLEGYGDRSNIGADKNIIAIRRALDAYHTSPFPDSWTNSMIYTVRQLSPLTPGFPDTLDTSKGTAPNVTNASLGNVLNAIGPGKFLGIGDMINAIQSGDIKSMAPLLKTDVGNLALYALGSRVTTTSTPDQVQQNNQGSSAIATSDIKNQALTDMVNAAKTGDYNTVAEIAQRLGLTNAQMIDALEHPPPGSGGGIQYQGLPYNTQSQPAQETLMGQELTLQQTSELEGIKQTYTTAMLSEITNLPEWKSGDYTTRMALLSAYTTLTNSAVNDMYSQQLGLLGGKAITQQDIQGELNTAVEFHRLADYVLSQTDLYNQADPLERARMQKTYDSLAINMAKDAYFGNLQNIPLENVRQILDYTINAQETTRSYLENSLFYQLAAPGDQARMLSEYSSLASTMAKREALGEGQGSGGYFKIPSDKMIPTIKFIMYVEETAKTQLHGTDYYVTATPEEQKALDLKYETLARGLAFSTSDADPRTLITNSLNSEQSYYDLQNQFGGSSYIKLMAAQLAEMERNARTSSTYSPQQIAALERSIRGEFLRQNPAYGAFLKGKLDWEKYTSDGQIYRAMNESEYSSVADMQSAGVINSDSLLVSGSSVDNTEPMDPSGLPAIDYNQFALNNP